MEREIREGRSALSHYVGADAPRLVCVELIPVSKRHDLGGVKPSVTAIIEHLRPRTRTPIPGRMANANEAVALYVEGLREDGESLDMSVVRRKIPLPA
jgi:hypothetical protein